MKQLIPRVISNLDGGGQYWAVKSGGNMLSSTFGANIARTPMPWAATARDLVIYSRDTVPSDLTLTVLKNGIATALTVTLPAGTTGPVYCTGVDVDFAQFDDIGYRVVAAGSPPGTIGVCLEVESEGNVFGVTPLFGVLNNNQGNVSGALGNGVPGPYTHPTAVMSGSHSICAVAGAVTTLVMANFNTPVPSGSTWTAYLLVEGVIQDGSGGTVDTRCVMTDADHPYAVATFSLPVALGQRVDVAYYRTGAASDNGPTIAIGIGFVPDDDGWFMLCGGSHSDVISKPTSYRWPYVFSPLTTEPLALAPIGPSGLIARGLFIERSGGPGPGESLVHTLRRNEANTTIAVTLRDAEVTGLLANQFLQYVQGDLMSLRADASADAASLSLWWGLSASIAGVGPSVSSTAVIGPHIWIVFYRTQPEIDT